MMNLVEAKQILNRNGYRLLDEKSKYDGIKDSRAELEARIKELASNPKDKAIQEKAQSLVEKLNTVYNPENLEQIKDWKGWESLYKKKIKDAEDNINVVAKDLYDLTEQSGDVFISTGKTEQGLLGILLTVKKSTVSQDKVNEKVLKILSDPKFDTTEENKAYLVEKAQQLSGFIGGLVSEFIEKGLIKIDDEPVTSVKADIYTQDDKGGMSKFQASKEQQAKMDAWAEKARKARWKVESTRFGGRRMLTEGFISDAFEKIKEAGRRVYTMFMFKLFGKRAQKALSEYVDAQYDYYDSLKVLNRQLATLEVEE